MAQGDVEVATQSLGGDRFRITATGEFDAATDTVWALLANWEQFVAVGLPGMTSHFEWLSGGPDDVPCTFQFVIAGATLKEEIYERTADSAGGPHVLRYRALEPVLGVVEYDAVLRLERVADARTAFRAVREVRLEPGTSPSMLVDMVTAETQCLKQHFEN